MNAIKNISVDHTSGKITVELNDLNLAEMMDIVYVPWSTSRRIGVVQYYTESYDSTRLRGARVSKICEYMGLKREKEYRLAESERVLWFSFPQVFLSESEAEKFILSIPETLNNLENKIQEIRDFNPIEEMQAQMQSAIDVQSRLIACASISNDTRKENAEKAIKGILDTIKELKKQVKALESTK